MDGDDQHLRFRNFLSLPRPGRPILHLAFPFFHSDPVTTGVFLQPQRRRANKLLGVRSTTGADPYFSPRMAPLAHIHTYVDNTVAQGWDNLGSVNTASAVGPILQEIALAVRCQKIHAYVGCITGEKKKMVDAMSRLTHLTDHKSLSHFSHTSRISSLGVCPPCRWNAGSS